MYASTNKMAARYRELVQGLEQRSHERVNLALECRVTTGNKRSGGSMKVVENISRTGILIRWLSSDGPQDVPRAGDTLTIEMALPANHNFDRKCWFCGGTVVRVSKAADNSPLVAVRINTTKFRKYTPPASHKSIAQVPQLVTATH
jgi:PilZ domain-containing protein